MSTERVETTCCAESGSGDVHGVRVPHQLTAHLPAYGSHEFAGFTITLGSTSRRTRCACGWRSQWSKSTQKIMRAFEDHIRREETSG